ncbi:hypothetical protein ACCO45_009886 [Purpureocillium lilacinum]|uniref:Uncharacterized protein n=3 Tax=Purpureocillium lilacinum TaxID=33203 RepID=A0ACC4DDD0_PURLI
MSQPAAKDTGRNMLNSTMAVIEIQAIFGDVYLRNLPFAETVSALLRLGVNRYHVDFTAASVSTYLSDPAKSDGPRVYRIEIPSHEIEFNARWNQQGVEQAIGRVQSGAVKTYLEFARQCVDAGVAGYHACLRGKRVVYYGHNGDIHVEEFPQ